MLRYGLKNCTERVKLAVDYIDGQLSQPGTAAKLKQRYLGRTAERGSNGGFAEILQYPFYSWQAAGVDDNLRSFCDHLTNGSDQPAGEEEDGARRTGKFYSDRWATWPRFIGLVNEYNPFGYCEGPARNGTVLPDCRLDERFAGVLGISWAWQLVTPLLPSVEICGTDHGSLTQVLFGMGLLPVDQHWAARTGIQV